MKDSYCWECARRFSGRNSRRRNSEADVVARRRHPSTCRITTHLPRSILPPPSCSRTSREPRVSPFRRSRRYHPILERRRGFATRQIRHVVREDASEVGDARRGRVGAARRGNRITTGPTTKRRVSRVSRVSRPRRRTATKRRDADVTARRARRADASRTSRSNIHKSITML